MQRYLRQLKTGAIYVMTPILAKRRDMVPYDADQATNRIEAIKTMLSNRIPSPKEASASAEEAALVKASAMELSGLEAKLESVEKAEEKATDDARLAEIDKIIDEEKPVVSVQTEEQLIQDRLDADPKYGKVMGFNSKNQVEEYMLLEFGQEIEVSRPFKGLKAYAVEQTTKRILEE